MKNYFYILITLIGLSLTLLACQKDGGTVNTDQPDTTDTTDNPPPVNTEDPLYLFQSGKEGYSCFRIPALIQTTKGTILAFAEARKLNCDDAGDIDMVVKRSTDNGKTWSNIQLIWDDGANTCGNPAPVIDKQTGYIFLLMTWNFEKDKYSTIVNGTSTNTRRVFVTHSEDDGLTWSTPKEITTATKLKNWTWYGTGPCHGIQVSQGTYKGRLVIPCYFVEKSSKKSYANVIYSDDHGKTWKLGGVVDKPGAGESTLAELSDGNLMLNMRTNYGVRFIATSNDGGKSWKNVSNYSLTDPACQGSLLSFDNKKQHYLFFSNPLSSTARENMTIQMSTDNGKTWNKTYTVYSGPSAYSDMAMLSDSSLAILYESGKSWWHDRLSFEIVTLDQFK